jgi:hypothetical protein
LFYLGLVMCLRLLLQKVYFLQVIRIRTTKEKAVKPSTRALEYRAAAKQLARIAAWQKRSVAK